MNQNFFGSVAFEEIGLAKLENVSGGVSYEILYVLEEICNKMRKHCTGTYL